MPPTPEPPAAPLSIGDLAAATGLSVDTLRIWERRYGRPESVRLPSGHRRYTEEHVRWGRRVAELMARGQRPGDVVKLTGAEMDRLLGASPAEPSPEEDADFRLVRRFDRKALVAALRAAWRDLGPRTFLEGRLSPLLDRVGRAWADGRLQVRHEHFLSETVEDLLRLLREEIATDAGGPVLLLATLSGERHGLGLQMAAIVATLAGARPHLLGTEAPVAEIAGAARELQASGVALSVSLATGGVANDRTLVALRDALPPTVPLVVGGAGARGPRRGPRGLAYVRNFAEFERWIRRRLTRGSTASARGNGHLQ